MIEEDKGSHLYPHVSFPQELHPKKNEFWNLILVYVDSEAMSSIYRGSSGMVNRSIWLLKVEKDKLSPV